jgi:hypothetical protein
MGREITIRFYVRPEDAALPPFTPTSIAGLLLWLKADALSLNNNDPVTTWTDNSGNGNDAAQSTGVQKPLFKTSQINSKPAIEFDGSNDNLALTSVIGQANVTVFLVMKPAGVSNRTVITELKTNVAGGIWEYRVGGGLSVAKSNTSAYGTSWQLLEVKKAGTVVTFYYNAVDSTSDPTCDNNNTATSRISTTGFEPFATQIAEILIYDSALSDGNRALVEGYLNAKYAIY